MTRLLRTLKLVAVLALVAPCDRLVAQQTAASAAAPAKTGKAEISGVVIDSLNGSGAVRLLLREVQLLAAHVDA